MSMGADQDDLAGNVSSSSEMQALEGFRRELIADLPRLLEQAVRSYSRFAAECFPEDSKSFVAYQAGCRAALAHVHLLVKLAQWTRSTEEDSSPLETEQLDQMVREAEDALAKETLDFD